MVISFVGVGLLTSNPTVQTVGLIDVHDVRIGYFLSLIAAVCYAAFVVLLKLWDKSLDYQEGFSRTLDDASSCGFYYNSRQYNPNESFSIKGEKNECIIQPDDMQHITSLDGEHTSYLQGDEVGRESMNGLDMQKLFGYTR